MSIKEVTKILRWFYHVERRAINAPVRKRELIPVEEMKKVKDDLK
jgi:hypothetical protein